MKKGFKFVLCFTLVVVMLASVVGCGKTDKEAQKPQDTTATGTEKTVTDDTPAEPQKLSILTYGQVDFDYTSKMPVLAEIEKRTNTVIDWQGLPVGAEAQKLDLVFAGGSLPDILIWSDISKITKLGSEGALIPLEDLIENHAPNIKATFNKLSGEISYFDNQIKAIDGHIYNIPTFTPAGNNAGMTWAIREDWCKNVGLEVPKTTDELYNVLKAFKEKDPNKNGEADEIPWVSRNHRSYVMYICNSFGTEQGFYWNEQEDKLMLGRVDPRFKEALEYVNKMHREGLLDNEFVTNTDDQFVAKLTDNRAGFMLGYANSQIGAAHDNLKEQNPEFNLISMLPVAGPRGDRFKEGGGSRINYRGSITSACKIPEAAMKFLDYCFSDEGHELLTWGIEGQTFIKVGDKKQVLDYVLRNEDGLTPMQVVNSFGIDPSLPHEYSLDAYNNLSSPFIASIFKTYSEPGIVREAINFTLTPEETEEMGTFGDFFDYSGSMISKFIVDEEPLSGWDKYIEQCKKFGVERILEIYDTAYRRQYK